MVHSQNYSHQMFLVSFQEVINSLHGSWKKVKTEHWPTKLDQWFAMFDTLIWCKTDSKIPYIYISVWNLDQIVETGKGRDFLGAYNRMSTKSCTYYFIYCYWVFTGEVGNHMTWSIQGKTKSHTLQIRKHLCMCSERLILLLSFFRLL